jgi:hypothetical protein
MREHLDVIRNVCIHMAGEQPLLADLYEIPSSADAGLVCTNLRLMDGKRPVFIDRIESTFFFPYRAVRFLEIPPGELERHHSEQGAGPASRRAPEWLDSSSGGDGAPGEAVHLPVPATAGGTGSRDGEVELDLEIDEDFLQRVRDI